jgi:hypothetical protein
MASTTPTTPQPPPTKPAGFTPGQIFLGFLVCSMPFGLLQYARRGGPQSVIREITKNKAARDAMVKKKEGPIDKKEYDKMNPKGWKEEKNDLF